MSVEILSNQANIDERERKLKQSIDEFKLFIAEKFKDENLSKINKALELMLEIHLPQKDRSNGEPYAKHPLEVAKKVLETGNNVTVDLLTAALLHDSAEDMPEILFAKRANRKFPDRHYELKISEETKKTYLNTLREWSFKELEEEFGIKVAHYLRALTNHDYDSLVEELPDLSNQDKIEFKHQAYASHVEEIIEDPDLCLLKYADFSKNIDLKNLPSDGEKYFKLKRKYASVIPIFIKKLKMINEKHQLYQHKESIIKELEDVYQKQYNI
jgi:hypothetical protein